MDPTPHYLAAENSATLRRYRALHRSIVASPFVLMLAVGLVGHVHGKPHFQPAGTLDYDHRVLAYRDRVVAVQSALALEAPSTPVLEREAGRWTSGFASGDLTSLPPAYYEDHLRDGPRGEVLRAAMKLSTALAQRAEEAVHHGDAVRGARDAVLASETSQGLRKSEVSAFLQCLLSSRRGLIVLATAWPRLRIVERDALRPHLRALMVAPGEIDALRKLERDQWDEYQTRHGFAPAAPDRLRRDLMDSIDDSEASAMVRSIRVNNAHLRALIDDVPPAASLR